MGAGGGRKYKCGKDQDNSQEDSGSDAETSYLHRSANSVFSRHLSWQLEQAVLRSPAAVKILSIFLDCAALYVSRLASRKACTNFAQSGLPIGTGSPFAHLRPGRTRRLAASERAFALFSTAIQPP